MAARPALWKIFDTLKVDKLFGKKYRASCGHRQYGNFSLYKTPKFVD
jgi:hypothetical protein